MTSHGWLTTTMIMLPLIAAVVIWVVPMPRVWVGPAALLVSLFEVGFWIEALVRYDFDRGGLQEWNHATWLKDLGVQYLAINVDATIYLQACEALAKALK